MSDERDERMEQDPNPAQGDPASAHERSEESGSPYGQYTYRSPGGQSDESRPAGDRLGYGRGPEGYANPSGEYRWKFEDYEAVGKPSKPPRRSGGLMILGTLAALVLVVGIVCLSGYGVYSLIRQNGEEGSPLPSGEDASSYAAAPVAGPELSIKEHPVDNSSASSNGILSTVEIAKRVRSSVVGIAQYSAFNTFTPSGQGSGIIINSDGYIVTNAHVVEGATGINVELDNDETYAAKLIGIDTKTDLAVIKIEAENLVAAEFGNSDALQVGERVIAIGNPGGATLAGSVSQGIVSGVNRTLNDGNHTSTYIQTDAAINPGNSGGALVNEYGQVVGINSAKVAAVDYEGIGFAIPVSEAKPIIDQLLQYGYVKGRAKLGITGQVINEALSQINGIPVGVYIWSIDPTSELAGKNVTQGDIIIAIDGQKITDISDISAVLKTKAPGDVVTLTLYRSAKGVSNSGRSFDVTTILMEDIDSGMTGTARN